MAHLRLDAHQDFFISCEGNPSQATPSQLLRNGEFSVNARAANNGRRAKYHDRKRKRTNLTAKLSRSAVRD